MSVSSKTLLLDHYHCTFFLPLIGVEDDDFLPNPEFAWRYETTPAQVVAETAVAKDAKTSTKDEDGVTKQDNDEKKERVTAEEKAQSQTQAAKAREIEAQAYRFFSPAIRNILFDCWPGKLRMGHLQPVKEWRIPPESLKSWELHLGKTKDSADPQKYQVASVTSVILYHYFNGIYLLTFRVEPKALAQVPEGSPLFATNTLGGLEEITRRDPANKGLYQQLQLESWLHFTRLARLIYPSFPQQNDEEKIVPIHLIMDQEITTAFDKLQKVTILEKPGEDISPIIRRMLKAFSRNSQTLDAFFDNYRNIYDDRMFVSVAYGLAGKQLPPEQLQKIFYLALFVDRHSDTFDDMKGHVYTPEEIAHRTQSRTMGLWTGMGGLYGYTEFSNAYLYRGRDFRTYIAPDHIPYLYDRMLIQALFYQASLRHYDDIICRRTQAMLKKDDLESIREQRSEFIRFTNQYWFHDLTEQMQGKEIFNLQQQGLGLKKHYDIIKDELERTDEYLQMEHEIRVSKLSDRIARWGLVIAVFALYYAALPLVPTHTKADAWDWIQQFIPNLPPPFSMPDGVLKLVWILFGIPTILLITIPAVRLLKRGVAGLWRWLKG